MEQNTDNNQKESIKKISGMYQDWFLDYASYVILERAIPAAADGLKPVQRRILHSMRELEDGRYNKVANIVGNTMKYHPHGDASIADAMVQLGQKDLLIDTQGNWGNIITGDPPAASRYIEARLTPFALEVAFNPKTTVWQPSYDGRNKEPITLPMKFPLLLAQGVEGIAVGLSTKLLPHNFIELIDASIAYLKGKKFQLYPDFPTGGQVDITDYNDGLRGGKVRIRAVIKQESKNLLRITEIPYSTTVSSLIESIAKASEKGKIKIKKIEDNTAAHADLLLHLPSGTSPDKTIDALYALTDCEISYSPNLCVIEGDKPRFIGVTEMLQINTDSTVDLLKKELEIELEELNEQWHFASLERIFIEHKVYRRMEEEETWEGVLESIDLGLQPHTQHLKRAVTTEDIVRLTEIRIKRISKFDLDKSKQHIEALEDKIEKVKFNLENLVDYAIFYYKNLLKKYGEGRERKTEIRVFEDIEAAKVAAANVKFYANLEEGFIGTSLKKDDFQFECSDLDDIIVFREDGGMMVTKVDAKTFVGKGILHVAVWKKKDKRTIYNMVYREGQHGPYYQKRFPVTSITRDKEYQVGGKGKNSKIMYFSANPNGEAEVVTVYLRHNTRLKKLKFELDFSELSIRSRNTKGNLVTKHPIRSIKLSEEGVSTLAPRKIWFDPTIKRLNVEERGKYLGSFKADDKILVITAKGVARLSNFDLANRFDEEITIIEKWNSDKPISCIYFDADRDRYFVKRFVLEDTDALQPFFLSENKKSFIELISSAKRPKVLVSFKKEKGKEHEDLEVDLEEFISVKGIKALGNQLTTLPVKKIEELELEPEPEPEPELDEHEEDDKEDQGGEANQLTFNFDE